MSLKQVIIYTDGGCSPNPGPGGYGVVLVYGDHRRELFGGFRLTTNNRMELTGAIRALDALKVRCQVQLFSDSQYLVNGMTKGWARRWQANGWRRKDNGLAENADLWEQLLLLCEKHRVEFQWIRGHSGHQGNERCDELATLARQGNLSVDVAYERLPD
jgi:ribonuclease HI